MPQGNVSKSEHVSLEINMIHQQMKQTLVRHTTQTMLTENSSIIDYAIV